MFSPPKSQTTITTEHGHARTPHKEFNRQKASSTPLSAAAPHSWHRSLELSRTITEERERAAPSPPSSALHAPFLPPSIDRATFCTHQIYIWRSIKKSGDYFRRNAVIRRRTRGRGNGGRPIHSPSVTCPSPVSWSNLGLETDLFGCGKW